MQRIRYLALVAVAYAQAADPAVLSRQGREAMAGGKYEAAAAVYRQLIARMPADAGLRMNLGLALFQSGQYRPASAELNAALKLQPGLGPAVMMLGICHAKLEEPAAAIPLLERSAASGMESGIVLLELGDAYFSVGRYTQAIAQFRRLTVREPANTTAWRGLGLSLSEQSQLLFTRLAPQSAEALTLLGRAKLAADEPKAAYTLLRRALEKDPGFGPAYGFLAALYRQTGHDDWAHVAQSRALPGTGLFQEIVTLSDQALGALAQLAALGPSADLRETEAEAARARGAHPEAIAAWKSAIALRPGSRRLERGLARSLVQGRAFEEALPLLRKLGMNGELGEALLETGHAPEAIPLLLKEPGAGAKASLGRAYLAAGEPAKAIAPLRAALSMDKDGSLHFQLARALQRTGDTDQARRIDQLAQQLREKLAEQQERIGSTEIGAP